MTAPLAAPPAHAPQRGDPRAIRGWVLFDFANSAFTTLVVTFIYSTYFVQGVAATPVEGTRLWSLAVAATAICVALGSPILGAIADQGGQRKRFLLVSTVITILGSIVLTAFGRGQAVPALLVFLVANVAFEFANVFYNAWLPELAPPDRIGRVSGRGWAAGYVGGLLCLVIALVGFVRPEVPWFGISTADGFNVRATNLLVAAWFAAFSLPFFLWVRDAPPLGAPSRHPVRDALRQLAGTFREVRRYREVVRLLVARLIYNDGIVTIFAFGGIYAATTFGFDFSEVIVFGIVLNVAAGLGAWLFGSVDDRIGGRKTILISLAGLFAAGLLAVLAQDRVLFWVAGIVIGLLVGPNQAASRSLLGRFVPPDKETEFFGFFAFSGKATAFLGPFLLGQLTAAFDSQRAGVAVVLVFFVVGAVLLWPLDEEAGRAAALPPGS